MESATSGWGAAKEAEMDPWDLAVERERQLQIQKHKIGLVLRDTYRIETKIGFGTYGSIYSARNIGDEREKAAIKFEVSLDKHRADIASSHLFAESEIYKSLEGGAGIPSVSWCGQEFGYNLMIMELLGPNLEQLHQFCDYQFSLATVLRLGEAMLRRVRWVHEAGFLHRDIKSANFLVGARREDFSSVYLIDFGLAKSYRIPTADGGWRHLEYREGRSMVGTARYASVNSHRGIEPSRRDDLEALGYILVAFRLGHLPWHDIKARNKRQRYKRMLQMKLDFGRSERLGAMPGVFGAYLRYCQRLGFSETPDYDFLLGLFAAALPPAAAAAPLDWDRLLRDPRRLATWDIMFKWTQPRPSQPPSDPRPTPPAAFPDRGPFGGFPSKPSSTSLAQGPQPQS